MLYNEEDMITVLENDTFIIERVGDVMSVQCKTNGMVLEAEGGVLQAEGCENLDNMLATLENLIITLKENPVGN